MILQDENFGIYEIVVDENNFTVRSKGGTTTNKDNVTIQLYNNHGFYSTLKSAILKIIHLNMLASKKEVVQLNEYIKMYNEMINKFNPFAQ